MRTGRLYMGPLTSRVAAIVHGFLTLLTTVGSAYAQSYSFDNPVDGSVESGIGVISGWHCTASAVRIEIDGNDIGNAGSGTRMLGTSPVCGHPDTGFSLLYNWNNLASGDHTVKAYADGVLIGSKSIRTIKSAGQQFATGLTKAIVVPDFPAKGQSATLEWRQTKQSFVVTEITSPPVIDPILAKTQLLLGTWVMSFTIISTSSQTYALNDIPGTTNSQGGYYIYGSDQYGNSIVAAYWPTDKNWGLLDSGSIIDRYYVFSINGSTLSGCYYQISHPSETWSRCYPLTGQKVANTSAAIADHGSRTLLGADVDNPKAVLPSWLKQAHDSLDASQTANENALPDQSHAEGYRNMRDSLIYR